MTIIKEKNKNIDFIINSFVFDELKELDSTKAIIAGGFVANSWIVTNLMDNPLFLNGIKDRIKKLCSNEERHLYDRVRSVNYQSLITSFNDIDIWLKDFDKFPFLKDNIDCTNFKSEYIIGDVTLNIRTSTRWANTFIYRKKNYLPIYQFIKKEVSSTEELFSSFDFENCKFGYENGLFCYTEGAINAFKRGELVLSNPKPFIENTLAGRVYSALRAFKYSNRHSLEFDEKLSYLVFKIMSDCLSVEEEDYKDASKYSCDISGVYMDTNCDYKTFMSMVDNLMINLKYFSSMKNYKKHWSAFFLGDKRFLGHAEYTIITGGETLF